MKTSAVTPLDGKVVAPPEHICAECPQWKWGDSEKQCGCYFGGLFEVVYLTNKSGCAKKSAYISSKDLLSKINVGRTT
jgi:hypothetical protein